MVRGCRLSVVGQRTDNCQLATDDPSPWSVADPDKTSDASSPAPVLFYLGAPHFPSFPFLNPSDELDHGRIHLSTRPLHTVHALDVAIPKGRLTAVTGMSGSGKTTLVLDSLVPALQGRTPHHVVALKAPGINRVNAVDATPIGTNVRSTVATYSGILDDLRRAYAATGPARERGLSASDFSYNTGSLRCPRCEGTGQISLDVQFLPDVDIPCPDCGGTRYAPAAHDLRRPGEPLVDRRHLVGSARRTALAPRVGWPHLRAALQRGTRARHRRPLAHEQAAARTRARALIRLIRPPGAPLRGPAAAAT